MLNVRLAECKECADISSLISEIDCRLATLADNMFNNITMMLNQPIPSEAIIDLLTYKRILQCRYVNPLYASAYSTNSIASKVRILKYKK